MSDERLARRALVLEADPLVGERLRSLLRAEQFAVCAVDEWELFRELAERHRFELYAASSDAAQSAAQLEWLRKLDPLLVLLASGEPALVTRLRMSLPGASLLERALRDPDAVRRALGAPAQAAPLAPGEASAEDCVRGAFAGFALSQRQLEVLACALSGETSRQIAARLYISEPTVRNHLHAIYERVGVSGRRELLGRFVRGLLGGALPAPGAAPRAASGTRSAPGAGGT